MSNTLEDFFTSRGLETPAIKHYGVLGMKWGVRRSEAQLSRARKKRGEPSEDYKRHAKNRQKDSSELSDGELKSLNNRLQNEKQLRELDTRGGLNKVKAGTAAVNTVLAAVMIGTSIYNLANSPAGKAAVNAGKKAYEKFANG